MITEDEVFDMAVKCAKNICNTTAQSTVSSLQQLILDAYSRGMGDAFAIAQQVLASEPQQKLLETPSV